MTADKTTAPEGSPCYIRRDLCPSGRVRASDKRICAALHRAAETLDYAQTKNTLKRDRITYSSAADECRRVIAALTPAPQPEGQVMDGWVDDKTFIEPLNHATPTAQEAVPVAWQWRSKLGSSGWDQASVSNTDPGNIPIQYEKRPLYAHPPRPSETVVDHEAIQISKIGNYYGGLNLKREAGQDFWCIEDYTGFHWEPCDPVIAAALRALEGEA